MLNAPPAQIANACEMNGPEMLMNGSYQVHEANAAANFSKVRASTHLHTLGGKFSYDARCQDTNKSDVKDPEGIRAITFLLENKNRPPHYHNCLIITHYVLLNSCLAGAYQSRIHTMLFMLNAIGNETP